jgi:hypothetical protein
MSPDPRRNPSATGNQLLQNGVLNLRIQVVCGGFVITTDKDFPGYPVHPLESTRQSVASKTPFEVRDLIVQDLMKRTESVIPNGRNRYNSPLVTSQNSLHSRGPTFLRCYSFENIGRECLAVHVICKERIFHQTHPSNNTSGTSILSTILVTRGYGKHA